MTQNPIIRFNDVSKTYDGNVKAVEKLSFSVSSGTLLAFLGASGCGKTTTLRLLAGLERPDEGEIWLNDTLVSSKQHWVVPEKRAIGMVFQDYALFPHMNVQANIAFALKGTPRREKQQRIEAMLDLVGLPELAKRFPHQLSGGQQQRVALARALAPNPSVVLLDEPFSNLDAALRKVTRTEVRDILKRAGATTVFVTHDQEEALSIADEVAVMRGGDLLQIGSPRDVYLRPQHKAVAAFVGDANFIAGEANGTYAETILGNVPLENALHGAVDVMLRPEMITLTHDASSAHKIAHVQFLGYGQLVVVQLETGAKLQVRTPLHNTFEIGETVTLQVDGVAMAYPATSGTI